MQIWAIDTDKTESYIMTELNGRHDSCKFVTNVDNDDMLKFKRAVTDFNKSAPGENRMVRKILKLEGQVLSLTRIIKMMTKTAIGNKNV